MLQLLLSWLLALLVPAADAGTTTTTPVECRGACWRPIPGATLAWQLQGEVPPTIDADIVDVDAVETPRASIRALQRRGSRVVCYVSAGSWERWRDDAGDYPRELLGTELDGWPGERWVDIRDERLRPILERRTDACAGKGFDGIEYDNVAGFDDDTGFDLTATDQLRFNRWLADTAHDRGLAALLKNDGAQARALEPWFDGALVEQCFQYDECEQYLPFVRAGKPVFVAEYELDRSEFCADAARLGMSAARYPLELDGGWSPCPARD